MEYNRQDIPHDIAAHQNAQHIQYIYSDQFRKFLRLDNGIVRTFGFTDITIDTFFSDFKRHFLSRAQYTPEQMTKHHLSTQ